MTLIIDLSLPIDDSAPEPFPVLVERIGHAEGAGRIGGKFPPGKGGGVKIDKTSFPDGMFISHESVTASVHCGTHVDAPWHFGPSCEGSPAKKLDELPLEWLYGSAVVLDMAGLPAGAEITPADVDRAIDAAGCKVGKGDIVLLMTGADRHFGTPDYFTRFAGLGGPAAEHILDMGVRVIGTDAPGIDRPSAAMVEDYYGSGDSSALWPAHLLGRKREYCHVERLANLGALPRPYGFTFACFPVKINGVGAAWARAVAIIEDV